MASSTPSVTAAHDLGWGWGPDGVAIADALVLFGASGDLAHRRLFPALYKLIENDLPSLPVVGVAACDWDDRALAEHAAAAVTETWPSHRVGRRR